MIDKLAPTLYEAVFDNENSEIAFSTEVCIFSNEKDELKMRVNLEDFQNIIDMLREESVDEEGEEVEIEDVEITLRKKFKDDYGPLEIILTEEDG